MPASQPANFNLQEFTDVGQLLVGGRLYTFAYGTTAQKIAYTDPDGMVPHTYTADGTGGQYIALNARGELPAPLYLGDGSYDISLRRPDGSLVWTRKADGVDSTANAAVSALQLFDYAALRSYQGAQKNVFVTGYAVTKAPSGIAGMFVCDDSDTTSADNGGTIIVAASGKRWKRAFSGPANVLWFGAAADWDDLAKEGTDDTAAVQAALNAHAHVYFPGMCRVTADITVSQPYPLLTGDGKYSNCGIVRTGAGAGTVLTFGTDTQYPKMRGLYIRWVPATATDYFNAGTVGIDITSANTSIDMEEVWVRGCQYDVKSNYNGYYTRFIGCRLEESQYPLFGFSMNNLIVRDCRFKGFMDAITANGEGGPANINHNWFEVFNGYLVNSAGIEQGVVNFHWNYVETYDSVSLPTNFPQAAQALPGKFGGNVLFAGPYGVLSIRNNDLRLGGVYIIASLSYCNRLESIDNNMHFHTAGGNLRYMYNLPTVQSCVVKDRVGAPVGADGGYSTVYAQADNIPQLESPYGEFEFFDVPKNSFLLCPTKFYTPTLLNGWTNGGAGDGVPALTFTKEGIHLQGVVSGAARSDIVIFTLPAEYQPLVKSSNRGFCFLSTNADEGAGGVVQLRYLYGNGDFRLENVPASANNIVLDGLFIPARI